MRTVEGVTILPVLLCLGLFSSCAILDTSEEPSLAETQWTLMLLNGRSLAPNTTITLDFEKREMRGFTGCNGYGGTYNAQRSGSLTMTDIVKTEQACLNPPGVMEQEAVYIDAFIKARGYRIQDNRLTLENADGETLLTYERNEEDS